MKKIDLHIHTSPTICDRPFEFDISALKEYVSKLSLDAIAITNHNVFVKDQFDAICSALEIPVFPGIEISIECGHMLVITSFSDVGDFSAKCNQVSSLIKSENSYISEGEFLSIFSNPEKYLLIPHFDKAPILDYDRVPELRSKFYCGEVNSIKKFESLKKSSTDPTPVYFSDFRAEKRTTNYPARCTYVDVDTVTVSSLKHAFTDKTKVSLSAEDGHHLTDILSSGLKISTGLTVLLGERSSGKTHTLDEISDAVANHKYIKQFSLLTHNAELDEKRFEETLHNRCASISEEYLRPFKECVEDVRTISLSRDDSALESYVQALRKAAAEADKEDIFSKTNLFSEPLFDCRDLSALEKLINAVVLLIENLEYQEIINSFVDRTNLIRLAIALMQRHAREKELNLRKSFLNEIIENIQSELRVKTAVAPIPEVDFYTILMNKKKITRFEAIATALKQDRIIYSRDLHSFKVIASAKPFSGAQELKNLSGKVMAFSDAFVQYNNPYEYLGILREKEDLPVSEYYKYFVRIKYEVLNRHGFRASGGERSEYNLLEQLSDATQYDLLLLDEPESSFDNLFLKSDVNTLIKDISKVIPVVVATHNNTIGASVKPDYILYTKKCVEADGSVIYKIFSGFPSSTVLTELSGETISRHDVLLDCLEAGEPAYIERRATYEMSDH